MSELNTFACELDLDRPNIEDYLPSGSIQEPHGKLLLRDLLDISPTLAEAAGAIVDDSFTRCFKSNSPEPWNWNIYLFPLWCLGVVVRYGLLFPLRVLVLTIGWIIFVSCYFPVHFLLKRCDKLRKKLERGLVELICSFFVASWTGFVKYHGPRPSMRPKQVFVANHTSMMDFVVLEQMTAFAVIMQKHPGWVGSWWWDHMIMRVVSLFLLLLTFIYLLRIRKQKDTHEVICSWKCYQQCRFIFWAFSKTSIKITWGQRKDVILESGKPQVFFKIFTALLIPQDPIWRR